MAVTHAQIAASVLFHAIETTAKESRRNVLVEYLNSILRALREVSATFEPAAATVNKLGHIPDNCNLAPDVGEAASCRDVWPASTEAGVVGDWAGIDILVEGSASRCGVKEQEERHSPSTGQDQTGTLELSDTSHSVAVTSPYSNSPWAEPIPAESLGGKQEDLSKHVLGKGPRFGNIKVTQKAGFDALISDLGFGGSKPYDEDMDMNTPDEATHLWNPGSSIEKAGFLNGS